MQLLIVISRFDIDGDGDIDEQEFEISRKEGEKAITNAIAGCQARAAHLSPRHLNPNPNP